MESNTPLSETHYLISKDKKPLVIKGFAVVAIGLIGMTYSAYAVWNRKIKPLTAYTIGAASALVSATPWVFSASSKTLSVLNKDLRPADILTALQANPDTEELDLREWHPNGDVSTLINYLITTQRLQRIQGQFGAGLPKLNSKNSYLKHLYAKLTEFPESWEGFKDIEELKFYLYLMPNLLVVDIKRINLKQGFPSILQHLYERKAPPVLFLCENLDKVMAAFPKELKEGSPEAKFLASLIELPTETEKDAETLKRILPFCQNLRTLKLGVMLSLDLAKAIGTLDPKKLSVVLQEDDHDIVGLLNKRETLSEKYQIFLKYVTKLRSAISNSDVAINLLRDYPNLKFFLQGVFDEKALIELTCALKNSPSPKMSWININSYCFRSDVLDKEDSGSPLFQLAIVCDTSLNWDRLQEELDFKKTLEKIGKDQAILFSQLCPKELELLRSVGSQRLFIIYFPEIDIAQLISYRPSAVLFSLDLTITEKTLCTLETQGYKAYISTVLEDRFGKKYLNSQPLDQFFEQGSLVTVPPYPPLRTFSRQIWDDQRKRGKIELEMTVQICGSIDYSVAHTVYFAFPNATFSQKVLEAELTW